MKKEKYNYFNEFIDLTDYIVKSADILKDMIDNYDLEKLDKSIEEIHKLEHSSDRIVHKMREYLIKDFLPPIDREDIATIANKLEIFNVKKIREDSLDIVDIVIKSANAVKGVFEALSNLKDVETIKSKVIVVNRLEEQGDRTYERIMSNLYKEEKDPIELIKWTNLYNCFENTIDSCEQISDCIQDVIMKNS